MAKKLRHYSKVEARIREFLRDRRDPMNPGHRYASFDYCYNYFQSFRDNPRELLAPKNIQMSCLQLGFYLASWGMLRPSSRLLKRSCRFYRKTIEFIADNKNQELWNIDVDKYDDATIQLLIDKNNQIRKIVGQNGAHATDTLSSKIMLGVYGNMPAFDQNVKRVFGSVINKHSLKSVSDFYCEHKKLIDKYARSIRAYEFGCGKRNGKRYTKAKIVDMFAFIQGQK